MDARHLFGDIAQLGEHLPCKQGVESSNHFVSIQGLKTLKIASQEAIGYLENRIQNKQTSKQQILFVVQPKQ